MKQTKTGDTWKAPKWFADFIEETRENCMEFKKLADRKRSGEILMAIICLKGASNELAWAKYEDEHPGSRERHLSYDVKTKLIEDKGVKDEGKESPTTGNPMRDVILGIN